MSADPADPEDLKSRKIRNDVPEGLDIWSPRGPAKSSGAALRGNVRAPGRSRRSRAKEGAPLARERPHKALAQSGVASGPAGRGGKWLFRFREKRKNARN